MNIITKPKEVKAYIAPIAADDWKGSQSMIEHEIKNTSVIAVLSGGKVFTIDKPSIETRFCFGHGQNGITSQEEEDRANEMAKHAEESVKYFMAENLKGLNEHIKALEKHLHDLEVFGCVGRIMYGTKYTGRDNNHIGISYIKWDEVEWYEARGWKPLSKEDTETVIEAYKQARALFIKRLETYLKRYGLSKVNTWTYLVD